MRGKEMHYVKAIEKMMGVEKEKERAAGQRDESRLTFRWTSHGIYYISIRHRPPALRCPKSMGKWCQSLRDLHENNN